MADGEAPKDRLAFSCEADASAFHRRVALCHAGCQCPCKQSPDRSQRCRISAEAVCGFAEGETAERFEAHLCMSRVTHVGTGDAQPGQSARSAKPSQTSCDLRLPVQRSCHGSNVANTMAWVAGAAPCCSTAVAAISPRESQVAHTRCRCCGVTLLPRFGCAPVHSTAAASTNTSRFLFSCAQYCCHPNLLLQLSLL